VGAAVVSALAHEAVGFDPLRDKSYRRAKLGGDVAAWLAWLELGGAATRTLDQYERDLARLCLLYPAKGIQEITDADLAHTARRFKPGERRVRVAALRSFFKWAKQTRRIADNPVDYLPTIRTRPQKVLDVFTEPEIDALLALETLDAAPLAVLLDAGLRKAEARHLTLRHCAPESGQVVVIDGKGGRDRIVPMSSRLRQFLADLAITDGLHPTDHIFYAVRANEISRKVTREKPVGEGTFARWWRRCLEQAGVRYRTPHTARHTFATRWRQRGLAIDELQQLLGHSSIRTTADVYVHTSVADIASHMALIEAGEVE
jgi:integrase/recombinase XerD